MKASFWDSMHASFERDVFDPIGSDLCGAFRRALTRFGRGAQRVADYGCGTGRQLPLLARRFDEVHGLDFAPKLLAVARERMRGHGHVAIARADLRRSAGVRGIELGICVNAWILPDYEQRRAMLRALRTSLAPGAPLILVIPSLEAALYVNERLIEWNRRSGLRGRGLLRETIGTNPQAARDLMQGVIDLDGSRTKHFLREEARVVLGEAGFEIAHEDRVEYPWAAYFESPPRWLRAPQPWDWLFVARRRA